MDISKSTPNEIKSSLIIKDFIRTLLKKHGFTYGDLAKKLEISEASVKRIMSEGDFSLSRLQDIAHFFGMDFFDFMDAARNRKPQFFTFSPPQEEALSKNPQAMQILILLSAGFTSNLIKEKLKITDLEFDKIIFKLSQIDLLTCSPEGKINILYRGPFLMSETGPLKTILAPAIEKEVFQLISSKNHEKYYAAGETYLTADLFKTMIQEYRELEDKYYLISRSVQDSVPSENLIATTKVICMAHYELWNNVLGELKNSSNRLESQLP